MVYQKHSDGGSAIYPHRFFNNQVDADKHAALKNAEPYKLDLFGHREYFVIEYTVSKPNSELIKQFEAEALELKLQDQCYEDATIEAAELVGPNSLEYDNLVESINERLFTERSASFLG